MMKSRRVIDDLSGGDIVDKALLGCASMQNTLL